jgi:hypothetical protein
MVHKHHAIQHIQPTRCEVNKGTNRNKGFSLFRFRLNGFSHAVNTVGRGITHQQNKETEA